MDGDGFEEILISQRYANWEPGHSGQAFLYASSDLVIGGPTLTPADAAIRAPAAHACGNIGDALITDVDLDLDGTRDLILEDTAYDHSPLGREGAFLGFTTTTLGAALTAGTPVPTHDEADLLVYGPPDGAIGTAGGAMPDLDGDGHAELLLLARSVPAFGQGQLHLMMSGEFPTLPAIYELSACSATHIEAVAPGDYLGAFSSPGDLDLDGLHGHPWSAASSPSRRRADATS